MKNIYRILMVILFLTIITACKKDSPLPPSCGQRFYYYHDQKINLYESKLKITIGFTDTLAFQEMKQIIDQYSFIKPLQQETIVFQDKIIFQDINEDLSCEEIQNSFTSLRNNPNILYANSVLVYNDNTYMAITDEFVVCLNDTTQLIELQNMALQTNTTIIKQNEFDHRIYTLSATKYSNGDALDMANYFQESHKYLFSAPNFWQLNIND